MSTLSVRLPADLTARLKQSAARNAVTPSALVRDGVEAWLTLLEIKALAAVHSAHEGSCECGRTKVTIPFSFPTMTVRCGHCATYVKETA